MLPLFAALLAASASSPPLEASVPWFERIHVTLDDNGKQHSCTYQFSLSPTGAETCDRAMASSLPKLQGNGTTGVFSKLTFERRFSPGGKLDAAKLKAGDKLLGQQVMFVTIDNAGSIGSCKVLATSGDLLPAYDCEELKSEQFRVSASAPSRAPQQGFMTIMVYGHQEQLA